MAESGAGSPHEMGRPAASQSSRESVAQRLTLDTVAPSMYVHSELFKDLLAFPFASPGKYGLDELWDGTQLQWKCADLHAGVSRHTPLLYELEESDRNATNCWQQENRMVEEVYYVQLFQWIKAQARCGKMTSPPYMFMLTTDHLLIPANALISGACSALGY